MSWFEKLMPSRISTEKRTRSVPEGVWIKCEKCDAQLYRNELPRTLTITIICPHRCGVSSGAASEPSVVRAVNPEI